MLQIIGFFHCNDCTFTSIVLHTLDVVVPATYEFGFATTRTAGNNEKDVTKSTTFDIKLEVL